ncbi:MAG: hypothetical protein ACT4PV_15195 [Planctomycetaceae bacterium]
MERELRERFNRRWTPELYRRVLGDLERQVGGPVPFRVAETPLFLPADSFDRFAGAAREIVARLSRPDYLAAQESAVPPAYRSRRRSALPQFAQVDFAVVQGEDGTLQPRCVELQGFPSLYCFQLLLTDIWATHLADLPGPGRGWRVYFSGLDRYRAFQLLRSAIVGRHDPEEVVLLDLDPAHQKTYPDFAATRNWFGVEAVCPTTLRREGSKLFRTKEGRTVPVRRFYQRVVFDELERTGTKLPFAFGEDLDVEIAPQPDWYYLWSKNSLVSLDHPAVPRTTRVSDLARLPADLSRFVLKPLYSFAGGGVNVDPTAADVEAIPKAQRKDWILQEKVEYHPGLVSPQGHKVRGEVRMMFVRPDAAAEMTLLFSLVRLSRGRMIGVNFNRDLDWVGASIALWPD